jgi:heat shock protein HtpX
MEAVGLQTHIWNNNLRSAFLLAGFPVLLLGIVYCLALALVGGDVGYAAQLMVAGAPLALIVAGVWFVIAYFANTGIIALATGAKPVTRAEEPTLYNLLENLCISRGMKTPKIFIIEDEGMNAFASGLNESQYTVTVTRGILETLTPPELEAVLAHELTHVINRDVRTMVIASVFAGIITLIAQVLYRAVLWGGVGRRGDSRGKGNGVFVLLALAAVAVGYVLSIVIRMALSRSREFVADAGSVELTKNPDAMISALQKISGHSQLEAPEAVRGLFLENHESGVYGLFATHPPIEKRIAALERFAGGRVMASAPQVAAPPEPAAISEPDEAGPWGARPRGPWG